MERDSIAYHFSKSERREKDDSLEMMFFVLPDKIRTFVFHFNAKV